MINVSKAKAVVAVRKRRDAKEASDRSLIERLLSQVNIPTPKDGRDAPTLSEVLTAITPMLPEAKVEHTTIVEKIDAGELEEAMTALIEAKLPKIEPEDRPTVEQITIDVSDEKLEGLVTKKELETVLKKIQRAIQETSGGGGLRDLPNVIKVSVDTTITQSQLDSTKYNVILVMLEGITVTLPPPTDTVLIEVKQGFTGSGTYTVRRA